MKRQLSMLAVAATVAALAGQSVASPDSVFIAAPANVADLALPEPVIGSRKIDPALLGAQGQVDVVVQLSGKPLVAVNGEDARQNGSALTAAQQKAHTLGLRRDQDAFAATLLALGGRELARVRIAYNAIIVRVDADQLYTIADYPQVASIRRVGEYQLHLSETVPYIGAQAATQTGADGRGVTVAVIDSGIDYTHRNLGGPGTLAAYEAAWGTSTTDPRNTTRDGLFPTAKVIAGYDFVGEAWPTGPLAPDEDPIDFEGHGTHVADIVAGESLDGTHKGVAPKAKLMAIKACSAVSSSCSGVALLQAIDFALDPNGDGCMDDAADVINMSLGSGYGQIQDDLSFASANAVRAGVVVVASAGNSGDRPFITGSPSSAPEVLSVAQTHVPSAETFPLVVTTVGTITNTNTVPWAPIGSGFSGPVARVGRGCPADSIAPGSPADPYTPVADLTGRVALVDRGACAVSLKVDRAAKAGAVAVILANNAAGDPPSFSFGGGDTFVPTIIITLADGNRIKTALGATGLNPAVVASVSSAVTIPLVGSMVASSSRGPNYSFAGIKPEIGAPGASISAVAGSGDGVAAFGGTSGAAPMVAGAAAALLSRNPKRNPTQVRALLVNTGETNILLNPATQPGVLAEVSRIGGGEVRVDRALATRTAAWDNRNRTPVLSFGYHAISEPKTLTRTVRVRNFDRHLARTYTIEPTFRYADDAASGAVSVSAPATLNVGPNSAETFEISITIDPSKVPNWPFTYSAGSTGGTGALLRSVEFDGYLNISDEYDDVHVPWHVLVKRAADVRALQGRVVIGKKETTGTLSLANVSAVRDGGLDAFALTGTSPRIPQADLPGPGDNFAVVDLQAVGVRTAVSGTTPLLQFAISTWGIRAHPAYPAEFDVFIDTNLDGVADYVVFTAENGALAGSFFSTGQTLVYVNRIGTPTATAFFFAITDLESGNMILTVPQAALGLTSANTQIAFEVAAFDNYFTGNLTDSIGGMVFTPGTPRFTIDAVSGSLPALSVFNATVTAVPGGDVASPSQSGILFLYGDAKSRLEADAVKVIKR